MSEQRRTSPSVSPVDRQVRRVLTAELPKELRGVYRAVLEHTLREGVPIDASALAVVLSVLDERREEPLRFIAAEVEALVWYEIGDFCSANRIEMPQRCVDALFAVITITLASSAFDAQADSVHEVFGSLKTLAGA